MIKCLNIILAILFFISCEETPINFDQSCETSPSYADCIQPIFDFSCTSTCHNSPTNPDGDLLLISGLSYNQLINIDSENYSDYKRVIPFEPDASLLYISVADAGNDVSLQMPPNSSIPLEQIEYIRKWIEQGALNN